MLVLSRKIGEALRIGAHVRVQVVAIQGGQVRLAIDAPDEVAVHREEVYARIAQANREATQNDVGDLVDMTRAQSGDDDDREEQA